MLKCKNGAEVSVLSHIFVNVQLHHAIMKHTEDKEEVLTFFQFTDSPNPNKQRYNNTYGTPYPSHVHAYTHTHLLYDSPSPDQPRKLTHTHLVYADITMPSFDSVTCPYVHIHEHDGLAPHSHTHDHTDDHSDDDDDDDHLVSQLQPQGQACAPPVSVVEIASECNGYGNTGHIYPTTNQHHPISVMAMEEQGCGELEFPLSSLLDLTDRI